VSGSSLGGVCFPIVLRRLFNLVGFGWAVRAAAFLIFGCLVIANFLVRSRLPPPGWTKGRQIFDFSALKEPVYLLVVVSLHWFDRLTSGCHSLYLLGSIYSVYFPYIVCYFIWYG
jgi:hypothetical protein